MRVANLTRAGCLAAALAILTLPAHASYVISIQQVGSDLVATGSGSLDTTDLTLAGTGSNNSFYFINGKLAEAALGPQFTAQETTGYTGVTGPTSWGTLNVSRAPSSGSGPAVSVGGSDHVVSVPTGYTSGTPLGTTTDLFQFTTLADNGLNPGTYTYTWGTGPDADSLTVQIGSTPEPASLILFPTLGIALLRRRHRGNRRVPIAAQREDHP